MNKWLLLVVTGALILPLLSASDTSEQQEAIRRMEQAVSKTNIFELPSFQLKASVQIDNQGRPLDGYYQLLWNGPEQWREEINFPGYTEVQVGGKGTVAIHRSTGFIPLRIYELHAALGFGSNAPGSESGGFWSFSQLGLAPKDIVRKTRSRKEHGEKLTCVEIENELKHSYEMCVSDSMGTPLRSSSYHDDDFQPVGGKVFPRFLSFAVKGKTVAKVNVSELIAPAQFPPNSFTPPAGVAPQAGCMNPLPIRLVKRVMPEYPRSAREQHVQGLVALDVWISVEGVPRIGQTVANPSVELQKSSTDAITGWRYEPAKCNGQPVPIETVLRVDYTLSP